MKNCLNLTSWAFNRKLLLINNSLLVVLLTAPMISGLNRCFANSNLCTSAILLFGILDYLLYKSVRKHAQLGIDIAENDWSLKAKAKILAWTVLISAVIFVGIGPIVTPSAYFVDRFTRIFGWGVNSDYSVSKKVHYFYYAVFVYGLLLFNVYQNICLSLIINSKNKIRRLGEFADTLLFVGYSFLLVSVYRQFSNQYGHDLTIYLLKSVFLFCVPAFYLWQTGKLKIHDIRTLLALSLFSLVMSANIVLYFDTGNAFNTVLIIVLVSSALLFSINKSMSIANARVIYSKIMILALAGAVLLVLFSFLLESSNIFSFRTGKFTDVSVSARVIFCIVFCLSYFYPVRRPVGRRTVNTALLIFVTGIALIQSQPALVIGSWFDVYETANYSVPISDFLNFGKIPLFENFPGHGLNGVLSSIAYGLITSDYQGAVLTPWRDWLYSAFCIVVLYCFTKRISNGLIAVSVAVLLPYFVLPFMHHFTSYSGAGLISLIPFIIYLKTYKKQYLILTVLLAVLVTTYKVDIGFTFVAGIICSSFLVSVFYRNRIIYRVLGYFALGGASVFALFLLTCFIKDINPLLRVQEYLSIVSSNDHWGYNHLGDTDRNTYSLVYFVVPVISVLCLFTTIMFRAKLKIAQFAVLLCLIFAYFANIPRFLVMHSIAQSWGDYFIAMWFWTMPFALPLLVSALLSSRSLLILCETMLVLLIYVFFQCTTFYSDSPLQNAVSRAEQISDELVPEGRKSDISYVFSRGSRVVVNDDPRSTEHLNHAKELLAVINALLKPEETYLDFTNQSAVYSLSRRENPAYVAQPPAMLSGERSQRIYIREIERKLKDIPIAIMPANVSWDWVMNQDYNVNNIWHYLAAEWIYNNFRPLVKYNDFASVWVLNSRYNELRARLADLDIIQGRNAGRKTTEFTGCLSEDKLPRCNDCEASVTEAGLVIKPTGPDPYIADFDRLIAPDGLKPVTYLTLTLADGNNGRYQLFFTSDKSSGYDEKHSLHSQGISSKSKFFDFGRLRDASHIRKLRLDVPDKGTTVIRSVTTGNSYPLELSLIDWGYDNFISLPDGAVPTADDISNAHDYSVEFLPFIWGQFDTRNASSNPDLAKVSQDGDVYCWNYHGHESKPAYLRVDLSVSHEFLEKYPSAYLILGDMQNDRFAPLSRFRFRLKEGKKVYLFRISADYYWSRGRLNSVRLDPALGASVVSLRVLEGD